MLPESKRLFVGNIPPGITESDLKNEFSAYGEVEKVELKRKENLVDPENPNVFGFVNIKIDGHSLNFCIDEFRKEKFQGRFLSVSVAKESFLDRLKREREENSQGRQKSQLTINKNETVVKELPKINVKKAQSSGSSESEDSTEDEGPLNKIKKAPQSQPIDESNVFITKKKASSSLFNGKVKIQSTSNDPIHVITKKPKIVKNLDEKGKQSDQKRKESQNKMKNQYNQQKLMIQKSLAAIDVNKPKRVLFDNEEMVNGGAAKHVNKTNLFNDDDEDEEDDPSAYQKDFEIKKQFLGEKGEELMKLQSRFKLDRRFKMNENFLEKDIDANDKSAEKRLEAKNAANEERSWQLGIIEQVIGRKFESLPDLHKKKLRKTMLRFDPSKDEHQKFLRNVEQMAQTIQETDKYENYKGKVGGDVEVSKEQFYTVNDDLASSLKRRGDGFSLLSIFGRNTDEADNQDGNKQAYEEKAILNTLENDKSNNPFKYDSSDSEDDDNNMKMTTPELVKMKQTTGKQVKVGKLTKSAVWNETFFIFEKDDRFKEGAGFFNAVKSKAGEEAQDYDQVKNRLRLIINKKIKRKTGGSFKNKYGFKRKA